MIVSSMSLSTQSASVASFIGQQSSDWKGGKTQQIRMNIRTDIGSDFVS